MSGFGDRFVDFEHTTQKKTTEGNKRMTGVDEDFLGGLQKANVGGRRLGAKGCFGVDDDVAKDREERGSAREGIAKVK